MSSDCQLPPDWKWGTIDSLKAPGRSIVSGPFGSNIGRRFFVEAGVPVIRGNNLSLGMTRFHDDGFVFLTEEKAGEFPNCEALPGDLLFTAAGTIGQVGIVPDKPNYPKYIISNKQLRARLDSKRIRSLFAYYWLSSSEMIAVIQSRNTGSTIPLINLSVLKSLRVPVPPLLEQEAIIRVLSSLDDRITLLRETNATLEAIAQALFKSWFVDFDPVRAKAEGRSPDGMDEATAALFPDGFEESELGLVPRGWAVGRVSDLARQQKGSVNPLKSPATIFEHYSLPAFDSGPAPIYEAGALIKSNKTPLPKEAVLLSKLNPHIPRVWLPVKHGQEAICSTEFLVFSPVSGAGKEFIYCLFSSPDFLSSLRQLVTGTSNSHQRVKPDQVSGIPSVIPPSGLLDRFTEVARPIFHQVFENRQQAQTLATLRDTLLPRLISGQLRLPEAEVESLEAIA